MSIPKLQLIPQPQAEIIAHATAATLDFTQTIIVNREQLTETYTDTRHASRILHNFESLSDLDFSELADICRTLHHASEILGAMLNAKGEAPR